MTAKLDRLGGALREVEAPLGRALHEYSPFLHWLDSDLQLSYSQCGIATAALQLYLAEQCSIVTERQIATLKGLPSEGEKSSQPMHVILASDDNRVIDPTYTQFFEHVGLSTALAQQFPDIKALLPEQKIALFSADESESFGRSVAERAIEVSGPVQAALATRALSFYRGKPGLLEDADVAVVTVAYESIWKRDGYSRFEIDSQAARYGNGDFKACLNSIVNAMK